MTSLFAQTADIPAPALAALLDRASCRAPLLAPVATLLDLVVRRMVVVSCDAEGRRW